VGTIGLQNRHQVVLNTDGVVSDISKKVGDEVKAGDQILSLETRYLDWAVRRAELTLESARLDLERLKEANDPSVIALAEAELLAAQENLALVAAGPTKEELAAAQSRANAAWATHDEIQKGPSSAQLAQLQAALELAQANVRIAQSDYDKIAWQPDAGASAEGAALQQATLELQIAQGAYDEATTISSSAVQLAYSDAQDAQLVLSQLESKPTPAELASAKAAVAAAESTLALAKKSSEAEVRGAEITVEQAMIDLEEAKFAQSSARVTAPISGTVLEILVEPGDLGSAGSPVAVIANTSALNMVVNIEQQSIGRVQLGQAVTISAFSLPDLPLEGVVEGIAPAGDVNSNPVIFPVTIRLTGDSLTSYRPGMTAVANFVEERAESSP
jgi:multidrug resistance efflux pump